MVSKPAPKGKKKMSSDDLEQPKQKKQKVVPAADDPKPPVSATFNISVCSLCWLASFFFICAVQPAGGSSNARKRNRWGDGIDEVEAGTR